MNSRFTISETGVLLCPVCDNESTFINQVALVPNSFTSIPGITLTAQGTGEDTMIMFSENDVKDSGQQHSVIMRGYCANWHQWDLIFEQGDDQTTAGTYQLLDMTSSDDQSKL